MVSVSEARPRHTMLVSIFQLGPGHTAGVEDHPVRFLNVGLNSSPIQQPSSGVKLPLKTLWVGGRSKAAIHIE